MNRKSFHTHVNPMAGFFGNNLFEFQYFEMNLIAYTVPEVESLNFLDIAPNLKVMTISVSQTRFCKVPSDNYCQKYRKSTKPS